MFFPCTAKLVKRGGANLYGMTRIRIFQCTYQHDHNYGAQQRSVLPKNVDHTGGDLIMNGQKPTKFDIQNQFSKS